MSDERPMDPLMEPAPEPQELSPAARFEPDVPRPRRSARHSRARSARAAGAARPGRAERRSGGARPARVPRPPRDARTSGGLPASGTAIRRRLVVAFTLLVLLVAGIAYGTWSTLYRASANVPAGRSVTITIAAGSSGEQVARTLAEAGIVDNPTMFRWRASVLGATSKLKAGTYTLKTGSAYDDVVAVLSHGPEIVLTTVTIPEGFDIKHTAARIQERLGIPAADFVKLATTGAKQFDYGFLADNPTRTLEGYLFPKTYSFKPSVTATDVINVMLTQYQRETATIDYAFAKSRGLSPHDVLTIASIIEREAQVEADRPKVASVIYNRLKIGMLLQADPTVSYALGGKAELTLQDLKTDNPYNTYVHKGVPPGPICSPGISAIKAAAHSETTKYLYYILTHKDGSLSFATNYADFLKLKAQFKKGLK
jgi:UPF0755 protein